MPLITPEMTGQVPKTVQGRPEQTSNTKGTQTNPWPRCVWACDCDCKRERLSSILLRLPTQYPRELGTYLGLPRIMEDRKKGLFVLEERS